MKRPGSSPATSRFLLASTTIPRATPSAHGPSHSEQTAMTASTGAATSSTGRNNRRGPTPTADSTYISESRYSRPSANR